MHRLSGILILFLSFTMVRCDRSDTDDMGEVVATAYGKKLYKSELLPAVSGDNTREDSIYLANEFIREWVRRQAMLHQAEEELLENEKDVERQLKQYREDLLIYALHLKMVKQNLDTEVSDEEVNSYYEENKSNFELKENIVRLIFFKIPTDTRNLERLWRKFRSGSRSDLDEIMAATVDAGGHFNRDEDIWLKFNDILKEIPITTYNQENYLNNNKIIRIQLPDFNYFVKILDFRIKNNSSPLEFERERIRSIIINKRKVALLKQLEEEIVQEGYKKNQIEVF